MGHFSYSGRNAEGALVEGVLEGADSGSVAAALAGNGVTPVRIRPASAPAAAKSAARERRWRKAPVKSADLLLFSRQMYSLLKAGVPILRALGGLQESSTNPTFKATLQGVRESLESGRDLSASLQRQGQVFTPFYVAMVYVGETTGRLEEIFLRLFHHLEFQEEMRGQVKSALRYPTFVIAAMLVALGVINLFVIPQFAEVYRGFGAELPMITRILVAVSDFCVNYWWLLLAAALGCAFGFRAWVSTREGRLHWDRIKMQIPIAGPIVLKATVARFARSFALAMRSGVSAVHGLNLVAHVVDNSHVSQKVERMREGVERGESVLRTAVATGVFTPVALQMMLVGEESGSLDDMMDEVADMYTREVQYDLKNLGAQIEPILIVLLGILVLIVALGVFLPIWDLGQVAMQGKGPK